MPQNNRQSNKRDTSVVPSGVGFSRSAAIREVTRDVLDNMSQQELQDHAMVEQKILDACQMRIEVENSFRSKGNKWKQIHELIPGQIADIIMKTYRVVCIVVDGDFSRSNDTDIIGFYNDSGINEGIYTSDSDELLRLSRSYSYNLSTRDFIEVQSCIRSGCDRVGLCRDKDLVAVNNGVFNYKTKQLMPFSPDYVFTSKSRVDYNPNATNPVIIEPDGNPWNVESWMKELSDDPEIVDLLWHILGAIIRPNVPWYKSAWFYAESGNNGKGTLCELMRQLCGAGSYATITLSDFSKEFLLEPLVHASAIIVDENDVGTFIDKAANLKSVVTGDSIMINRKFKTPIIVSFHGFMVQCLNEMPRIKDKSDSFFRRQLFVPFTKCFTGVEKKYIKNDYLHRKDVLEYVLWRVLNMNYYELPVPAACAIALDEYKEFVDPVRAFLIEMMPLFSWKFLPYQFLYELYVAWYHRVSGGDRNVRGRASFIKDVQNLLKELYPNWTYTGNTPMRPSGRIKGPEPLIAVYNLENWMNPMYKTSSNTDAKCSPVLVDKYRGIYET